MRRIPKATIKMITEFRNSFNHNWLVYTDTGLMMFETMPFQKNDGSWTCDGACWHANSKFNVDMFREKCENNKAYFIDLEYHPYGVPGEKRNSIIKCNIIEKKDYPKWISNEKKKMA